MSGNISKNIGECQWKLKNLLTSNDDFFLLCMAVFEKLESCQRILFAIKSSDTVFGYIQCCENNEVQFVMQKRYPFA